MLWILALRVLLVLGQDNQAAWEECLKQGNESDIDCYTCDQLFNPSGDFILEGDSTTIK